MLKLWKILDTSVYYTCNLVCGVGEGLGLCDLQKTTQMQICTKTSVRDYGNVSAEFHLIIKKLQNII